MHTACTYHLRLAFTRAPHPCPHTPSMSARIHTPTCVRTSTPPARRTRRIGHPAGAAPAHRRGQHPRRSAGMTPRRRRRPSPDRTLDQRQRAPICTFLPCPAPSPASRSRTPVAHVGRRSKRRDRRAADAGLAAPPSATTRRPVVPHRARRLRIRPRRPRAARRHQASSSVPIADFLRLARLASAT